MTNDYNDSPIDAFDNDKFGIGPFAKALATSIRNIKDPVGTTIGLHGPWGSGKSSAVNLIRQSLKDLNDPTLVVSEFKPWWFRGEEALALAFLQHLHAVLKDSFGDKVKDLIPSLGRGILQAGPVVGTAVSLATASPWVSLFSPAFDFAKGFFPDGPTVEKSFKKLSDLLAKENRRFFIIIDDIDRLTPLEALAVFRLVKSVGRLPNVLYLLVYDRDLAEAAVQQHFPSEGLHFLEKIIQAPFELPLPLQADLNSAVLGAVTDICSEPTDPKKIQRFMNLFYDIVVPHIKTPRHVTCLRNAISVTWPAIKDEIDLADFLALETLRLYNAQLFNRIRTSGDKICGTRSTTRNDAHQTRFDTFLDQVDPSAHDLTRTILMRLFPKLDDMGYGPEFVADWDAERRVCVAKHFETYFRLSLSADAMPIKDIHGLATKAADKNFVKQSLREASGKRRKSGHTYVPVLLDELNTHAAQVPKEAVGPLISVLFELHDEIDRPEDADKGFMAMANTSLRIHWLIRRLTQDRFSLSERDALYLDALQNASLGWLVDFTSSAVNLHREEDRKWTERDLLLSKDGAEQAKALCLQRIRAAAADGSLIEHCDLASILYRWRDFSDLGAHEVSDWTSAQIKDPQNVLKLASSFISTSWSLGMGFAGLGDRVAIPQSNIQLKAGSDIVDVSLLIATLEKLKDKQQVDDDEMQTVSRFLSTWEKQDVD